MHRECGIHSLPSVLFRNPNHKKDFREEREREREIPEPMTQQIQDGIWVFKAFRIRELLKSEQRETEEKEGSDSSD